MKYILIRLTKGWLFWTILFLCFFSTLLYSVKYYENSSDTNDRWSHFVEKYENHEELKEQINELTAWRDEINDGEAAEPDLEEEELDELRKDIEESIKILEFLEKNELKYEEVVDGNILFAYSRDRRSYSLQAIDICLIFSIIAGLLLLCQIVNQGRTNGASVCSLILRGRKKCFLREAGSFFLLATFFFAVQTGFLSLLRTQIASKTKFVLYIDDSGITLLTERQEYLFSIASLYLVLLLYWALLFFVSELIDHPLKYLPAALAVVAAYGALTFFWEDNRLLYSWRILIPSIFSDNITLGFYLAASLARLLVGALLIYLAWLYSAKRSLQIHYE